MSELKTAKRIPILRILTRLRKFSQNPIPFMQQFLDETDGLCEISLGMQKMYLTRKHEIARHILQQNHRNYIKSKIVTEFTPYIGHGLLTVDGAYWRRQRRLLQPGFHKAKLQQLTEIMLSETEDFMQELATTADRGEPILMAKEMMEVTMKVVARGLFGSGLNDEDLGQIDRALTEVQQHLVTIVRKPMVKPLLHLLGKERKVQSYIKDIDAIIYGIVAERRASGEQQGDLLDMLLDSRYEDTGLGMTDKQIRDESLIFFVAGHETSANALTWVFYLLSKHPEVLQKVRAEVDTVSQGGALDFDKVNQLHYIKQVLMEGMRMYPPAWIVDRVALEDDQVAGYKLPKDIPVNLLIYGIHHDPELWPEPQKFDPDRFTPEKIKQQVKFSYFPFGGGPRLCIGQGFAMLEMQIIVAELANRFDFSYADESEPELFPLVTLRPLNNMPMLITNRTEHEPA